MRVEKRLLKGGSGGEAGQEEGVKRAKTNSVYMLLCHRPLEIAERRRRGTWSEMKMTSQNNTRESIKCFHRET